MAAVRSPASTPASASGTLTVAVAQPVTVVGDLHANAVAHAELVLRSQAQLVVFPELSLTGYDLEAAPVDMDDDDVWAPIADACQASGVTALVGAVVPLDGAPSIATVALGGSGVALAAPTAVYHKTFLGDDEAVRFAAGPGSRTLDVAGWRVGLGICKDTRMLEHIEATLALGIDLYAAGLVHRPDEVAELSTRAAKIQALAPSPTPVVFAAAAGPQGSGYPRTSGCSTIWSSAGTPAARASTAPNQLARATLTRRA